MNTNKIATGSTSKRLLAALAVLAVAFVVLAAVPAVADSSDADGDSGSDDSDTSTLYVNGASTSKDKADGSKDSPYTKLSKAYKAAKAGDMIEVIGDTTVAANYEITTTKYVTIKVDEGATLTLSKNLVIGKGSNVLQVDGKLVVNGALILNAKLTGSGSIETATAGGLILRESAQIFDDDASGLGFTGTITIAGEATTILQITASTSDETNTTEGAASGASTSAEASTIKSGDAYASYEAAIEAAAKAGIKSLIVVEPLKSDATAPTVAKIDLSKVDFGTVEYLTLQSYNNNNLADGKVAATLSGSVVLSDSGLQAIKLAGIALDGVKVQSSLGSETVTTSAWDIRFSLNDGDESGVVAVKTNDVGRDITIVADGKAVVLIEDVPEGATLSVSGDKDSIVYFKNNMEVAGKLEIKGTQVSFYNSGKTAYRAITIDKGASVTIDKDSKIISDLTVKGAGTLSIGSEISEILTIDNYMVKEKTVPSAISLDKDTEVALAAGGSVVIAEGASLAGSISYTEKVATAEVENTIVLSKVAAGTAGVTISTGSIEIQGEFTESENGATITVTGDAHIVGDSTIDEGVTLTVDAGATLTVDAGATLKSNGSIVLGTDSTTETEKKDDGKIVLAEGAEGKEAGSLALASSDGVKTGSDTTYIVGSEYTKGNYTYTIAQAYIGETAVYYGYAARSVDWTGSGAELRAASPGVDALTSGLTAVISGAVFTSTGSTVSSYIAPGTYPDEVSFTVSLSTDKGAVLDYPMTALVIKSVDLSTADAELAEELTYNGSVQTPGFSLTYGQIQLVQGTDFTVEYYTDEGLTTKASELKNAGTYYAKFTPTDSENGSVFGTTTAFLPFEIQKAKATVEITATSYADQQYDGNVTYVVVRSSDGATATDDNGTVTVWTTTTKNGDDWSFTSNGTSISGTTTLDSILEEIKSEDRKAFSYGVKIQVASTTNYEQAEGTATVEVSDFEALKDYIKFTKTGTATDGSDTPAVSQDGYTVTLTGKVTDTDSSDKYSYKLNVTMTVDELITLDFGTDGNAAFSKVDGVTVTPGDATSNVYTVSIVISKVLPVTTLVELTVTAAEDETVYTTQTYSIDLSGLIPDVYSIILSEDGAEKDITELVEGADAPFLVLPATQGSTDWTLGSATYQPGSVYVIDAKDMVEGVITFTATGSSVTPAEPVEAISYTVSIVEIEGTAKVLIAAQSGYIPEGTGSVTVWYTSPVTGLIEKGELTFTVQNTDKASVVYAVIEDLSAYDIKAGLASYNDTESFLTQIDLVAAQE